MLIGLMTNCCLSVSNKPGNYSSKISNYNNISHFDDSGQIIYQYNHQVKWLCLNSAEIFNCCQLKQINCTENGPILFFTYCATYSVNNVTSSLSFMKCHYSQRNTYNNMISSGYISLPVNLTELNDYMCGPINRKGLVCSECADGYGPSFTSYGYKCANCTNSWYNVPLFVFVYFVPITVLYIIVLVFRISAMSPPMPCFIMYAHFVVIGMDILLYAEHSVSPSNVFLFLKNDGSIRLDIKIVNTFYGVFGLQNILLYILEPHCLSGKLKQIHIVLLEYISVFYPIFLILVTWACIHLHGDNFRPIVWLWRPFHKCFVHLRKGWDTKSDIVDVFITFFLFSYTKNAYVAYLLLHTRTIRIVDQTGEVFLKFQLAVDPSVAFWSPTHLPFAVTAILLLFVFNILPILLLLLYPFKAFQLCLLKCRLDRFFAVNIFVDKMQSCYKDGLDGGRDMRSFSALYFCFRIGTYLVSRLLKTLLLFDNIWFSNGVLSLCTALIVVFARPYKKDYMNHIDALILSSMALQCFGVASSLYQFVRILFIVPIIVFILIIIQRKMIRKLTWKLNLCSICRKCCISYYLRRLITKHNYHRDNSREISPSSSQPLIQPTSSEICYGTCDVLNT